MSEEDAQEHFDDFFEDVFVELEDKYGEIEEMNVCDNLGDHLVGNVYVKVLNIFYIETQVLKSFSPSFAAKRTPNERWPS